MSASDKMKLFAAAASNGRIDMVRDMLTAASLTAALLMSGLAPAQSQESFPTKPIKLLVGFPAGGPSDIPARLIADKLRVSLGQTVVVENKTGAAGMIALNDMLAQPRDGHTLLLCSYIDAINPLLYKKVSYKLDDVVPVSLIQKAYYAFTVSPALPVNTLSEFIAHAKARPGALNYGRVGAGSVTEVLAKQFEKIAGISMTGVTFRGTGPALQEMVAGRLDFIVGPLFVTMPLYAGKKVKVLGMTSPERLPVAPEVPTLKEQGIPIVSYGWWGVCAPSGVPKATVDILNRRIAEAVASSDFKAAIEKTGVAAVSSTVEEAAREYAGTSRDAAKTFRELGIEQID
jgi:tripartite-type tricarboxylate transporter receptor subunit TctC